MKILHSNIYANSAELMYRWMIYNMFERTYFSMYYRAIIYNKYRPMYIINYYKSQTGNKNISKFKPKLFKKTKFGRKEI